MTILHLCEAAGVSRAGFYRRHNEPDAQTEISICETRFRRSPWSFPVMVGPGSPPS